MIVILDTVAATRLSLVVRGKKRMRVDDQLPKSRRWCFFVAITNYNSQAPDSTRAANFPKS